MNIVQRGTHNGLSTALTTAESLRIGCMVCTLDGKILYTNPAGADIYGYEGHELVGHSIAALDGLVTPDLLVGLISNCNAHSTGEFLHRDVDGHELSIAWSSKLLRGRCEEALGVVSAFQNLDRTPLNDETQATTDALLQSMTSALESSWADADYRSQPSGTREGQDAVSARYRRRFLEIASHELRTPLAALAASLQLLQTELSPHNEQHTRLLLGVACRNCSRLVRLIEDLLELDSLLATEKTDTLNALDLRSLLEKTVQDLHRHYEGREVALLLETRDGPTVLADRARLHHLLRRLISQAIERSDAGDVVFVEVDYKKSSATISVTEPGLRFTEETRTLRLEDLWLTSESESTIPDNLRLERALATRMNGTITATSSKAHGTTVLIELALTSA